MSDHSLDSMVLGPAPSTGDDWYFTPRPAEGLDAADLEIVSVPAEAESAPAQHAATSDRHDHAVSDA
jgi:hypothetical protein